MHCFIHHFTSVYCHLEKSRILYVPLYKNALCLRKRLAFKWYLIEYRCCMVFAAEKDAVHQNWALLLMTVQLAALRLLHQCRFRRCDERSRSVLPSLTHCHCVYQDMKQGNSSRKSVICRFISRHPIILGAF